jgi:hypothetical protein
VQTIASSMPQISIALVWCSYFLYCLEPFVITMKLSFVATTLSALYAIATPVQARVRRLGKGSCKGEGSGSGRSRVFEPEPEPELQQDLQSFFNTVYATTDGATMAGVECAANALTSAYNQLIDTFENPFRIRMASTVVISTENDGLRRLQTFNFDALLGSTGSCSGCSSGTQFTDQTSGRLLTKKTRKNRKGEGGKSESIESEGEGCPQLREGLPTEEELREAYSATLAQLNCEGIIDVTALDEIDEVSCQIMAKMSGKV